MVRALEVARRGHAAFGERGAAVRAAVQHGHGSLACARNPCAHTQPLHSQNTSFMAKAALRSGAQPQDPAARPRAPSPAPGACAGPKGWGQAEPRRQHACVQLSGCVAGWPQQASQTGGQAARSAPGRRSTTMGSSNSHTRCGWPSGTSRTKCTCAGDGALGCAAAGARARMRDHFNSSDISDKAPLPDRRLLGGATERESVLHVRR
jgi:hypothetical protein